MSFVRGLNVEELLKRGSIKDADVGRLRRGLAEGPLTRAEAEALLAVNGRCRVQDSTWADPFVGAISDYIVNREAPEGYMTVPNAEWLAGHIASGGRIETKTELELLVRVLEAARWAPESFCLFALGQVQQAVSSGRGPLRPGASLLPGHITANEVEIVRRILLAFAGNGSIAITESEAEALFAIEEALAEGGACPAWTELFAKAVANALMSAVGLKAPPREEALRRVVTVESGAVDASPAAALGDLVRASLAGVWSGYREQSREERALGELERRRIEIITNEAVAPAGADWLVQRLGRAGRMSANGLALLQVLKAESPRAGPALHDLVQRIPVAA